MFFNQKIKASIPEDIINKYYREYGYHKPICNAPLASLYFFPDGDVSACCLNKSYYSYGHYPEDSIKKIIQSKNRTKHQHYLTNNNFSLGCGVCEENLCSENFAGLLINGLRNIAEGKQITKMDFELSHLCNFDCIMCHKDKNLIDTVYDDRFVSMIHPYLLNIKYATFLGGEPFLIPVYYKIWEIITTRNKQCELTAITNGSILNDKVAKLARHPHFYIGISLDSINEETYAAIRVNGELKKTLKNFYFFNDCMREKNHTMGISVCPQRLNWKEMPDLVEFANQNHCFIFFNHVYYPEHLSLKYLSSSQLQTIIEYYKQALPDLPDDTELHRENLRRFNGLLNLLVKWHEDACLTKVLKSEIVLSLEPFQKEFSEVIPLVLDVLPESFPVSRRKFNEIRQFDYRKGLMEIKDKSQMEIEKMIRSFYELNLNESDREGFTT